MVVRTSVQFVEPRVQVNGQQDKRTIRRAWSPSEWLSGQAYNLSSQDPSEWSSGQAYNLSSLESK